MAIIGKVWSGLTRLGAVAVLLSVTYQTWDYVSPDKPTVSALRKTVADKAIPAIVEDLRLSRSGVKSVAILSLVNDDSGYVTERLRSLIDESGVLLLRDKTVWRNVRSAVGAEHPSHGELAPALEEASSLGVDGVVFGTVRTFESYRGGAKLDVDLRLADVSTGTVIFEKRYVEEIPPDRPHPGEATEKPVLRGFGGRLLAWILTVLLLPVFTIGFPRAMVRKESNLVNLVTLGIYTVVGTVLAYFLLATALSLWLTVVLLAVVAGATFAYNAYIIGVALKLEA